MENYADYSFYQNEYKGNLSVDLFNSFIVKASREIDKNVNRELTTEVIEKLTEREQWQLSYCACELCDFLKNSGGNTLDNNANSISIDGVSINKATKTNDELKQVKKNIVDNLPDVLTRYI